ncbi:MFS transporter [Clostridium tarantellae]|uniref:MFS transporter n=1 Tax=Clostridium tarantellae TaxID=39493 RepID=A0A6I1MMV5_9CLOT|nr:MFS transporter [Clostridium tarantellae]MPQ44290.1 MFS transporter [Clostridium tarantellae]
MSNMLDMGSMNENASMKEMKNNKHINLVVTIFLLGVFMGVIDTGIVSPVREIIASYFNVNFNTSIWLITAYTITYAIFLPIVGSIADQYGKIKVFRISIIIFGVSSLLCGISGIFNVYWILIISRIFEAIGAGGMMPLATAYIGEAFPMNKRGYALGLVGAVYGVGTAIGPTLGSLIVNIFGLDKWGLIFLINVPISIVVLILLMNVKDESIIKFKKKIDVKGGIVLSLLILSLMYSLTNLNFGNILESLINIKVYPFFIIFIILVPIFIKIESNSNNPILNLVYFKDRNICTTLILSFCICFTMADLIFIPQLAANVLRLPAGSGGYFVTVVAIFSALFAPLGGKLIDKFSVKNELIIGFISIILGGVILSFITTKTCDVFSLIIALILTGIGNGLTMGTPINYLMECFVPKENATSGQAAAELLRSIGTALASNLLINFMSNARNNIPHTIEQILLNFNINNKSITYSFSHVSSSMANK